MDHGTLRELAAGAVLDDLEPAEEALLDAHLATCGPCFDLAGELDDLVGELALAAPARAMPPGMRAGVMSEIHAAAPLPSSMAPARPGRLGRPWVERRSASAARAVVSPGSGRRSFQLAVAGMLVLGAVAVGLGLQVGQLDRRVTAAESAVRQSQSRVASADAAVVVLADPAHKSVTLHPEAVAPLARAVVVFRPGSADAYLMATDLPRTGDGEVYQLWYADGAGVHALGTFRYDGQGPFVARFGVDLAGSSAAMVTLEPTGGSTEPGPQVVFGEF